MISLSQKDLAEWQERNFGKVSSEYLALGVAEETGELCHAILKRSQKIREGANGEKLKDEIGDAFADIIIYGINLMESEGIDAEEVLRMTIQKVMERDWKKFPKDGLTQ